jgi:hypothetical protein
MIYTACQSALRGTSSIARRRGVLYTTFLRIKAGVDIEKCFICKSIYDAILTPNSGFDGILTMIKLAEERNRPEWKTLALTFSTTFDTRPGSHGAAGES